MMRDGVTRRKRIPISVKMEIRTPDAHAEINNITGTNVKMTDRKIIASAIRSSMPTRAASMFDSSSRFLCLSRYHRVFALLFVAYHDSCSFDQDNLHVRIDRQKLAFADHVESLSKKDSGTR